ncbi:nucleoside hydrolase [Microcella humidisoli]|uniref:Nucleoside hydrolase n=1 Tax=Microcella humidisoli TaxID=2963406 RepID=A0ABY5FV61_9MICO|nr:nucleoside hydrolase [Microcella humidisoli]UTT62174.1 nucleoside hydrolase [Microcella humidisoli]
MTAVRPVILDVDTGVDDALAILLAVRHPALDVRAITCTGGNAPLAQVVTNTLRVLDAAGAGSIPVAAGAHRPLLEAPQHAAAIHGADGLADLGLPDSARAPEPVHAVELLRRSLAESETPLTIISLAPLTNIALLVRMHPEVLPRIERVVMMGGAVGTGNATAAAEFNVWHDPEAAAIVLGSGLEVLMYGLEPFYRVAVSHDDAAVLAASTDAGARLAGALLTHLIGIDATEERVADDRVAIGDAGAVCAAIDPSPLVTRRAPVEVALAPGATRGQTVVDLRTMVGADISPTRDVPLATVVTDVDPAPYRALFLDALLGAEPAS